MHYIALICDDAYAFPTRVTIQSIISNYNHANTLLKIYVCTFGLLEQNVTEIEAMSTEQVNVEVKTIDKNSFLSVSTKVVQKSHVSKSALIKLELPQIFNNLNTILYLDSDIIVKKDLSPLFDINIDDKYLAAAYEFYKYEEQVKYVFKPFRYRGPYINSGVMLLNLKKMREDNISSLFWDYKLNKTKTTAMDQETINAVCGENSVQLTNLWNFNPIFNNETYLKSFRIVYGVDYKTMGEFINDVVIIHYVGKMDKPWKYKNAVMSEYWNQYYQLLKSKPPINYCEEIVVKHGMFTKLKNKISEYGILGTIHYILYLMGIKL